ncbi:HlyD family secretion protein [Parasphingorhabdus sp.]|uniref:HlyD family secretion protein n=1 Tax=Parasphingorhabdus sp. TaxID=2709688 RepID=UPI003A5C7B1D
MDMLKSEDLSETYDSSSALPEEDKDETPADGVPSSKPQRRWSRWIVMALVPLALIAVGGYIWLTSGQSVSTDNAYVQQDRVSVAAEVGGRIIATDISDNDLVKEGDILFRIDPAPFEIALAQANAAIAAAEVQVQALRTTAAGSSVDISAAREDIAFAQATFERQRALMQRGFTTKADFEAAQHAVEQARERLRQAQADAAESQSFAANARSMPGENPAIAAAKVQRDQAQLNLSRTVVRAPSSGRVAQADRLQIGQMMVSGLPALTIVADKNSWVEANFKETDLDHMRVGQQAEIRFDAYPDVKLKGHVESIGAGTGSEFSVLPAQNATGNWVKVTQRVPVRIAIDEASPRPLIAGLSTEVTVDIRSKGK